MAQHVDGMLEGRVRRQVVAQAFERILVEGGDEALNLCRADRAPA
jgi:hypothetical protein